jgi:hypothetical protein
LPDGYEKFIQIPSTHPSPETLYHWQWFQTQLNQKI